jgi:putative ABC transport system permease protein
MDRFQLGGSVLLEAAGIGVIGATIAVGLGMGIGFLMTITMRDLFAWRIGFLVPGVLVAQTVTVTVLLGVLAAYNPSRRAARTPIVEAVRYE